MWSSILNRVMPDIAYHGQEGDHVLLVLPCGTCQMILEIRLDVRRAVLQDQVICPGSVIDPGVLVLLILLLYDHEQIQVEFPLGVVDKLVVQLSVGEPVTGFDHGLSVRNMLVRSKLVVLPWCTYGLRKYRFYHIFHRLSGVLSLIHMPLSNVLCQLVKGILEPPCIYRSPPREGYLFKS